MRGTPVTVKEEGRQQIDPNTLTVVPLRHPWRLTAVVLVVVGVLLIVRSAIFNPNFQWPVVATYLFNPLIMNGLGQTISLTFIVMVLAIVGGTIAALMMLSPSKLLSIPAMAFVWLFRGTPALVQLILWYNLSLVIKNFSLWIPGYGTVFSVSTNDVMTPMVAAVVALSLHESGYMAEIVRGGLKSVNRGQGEAAACLGMSPGLSLRRIILPQAMRMIIPPTGNETINLLKTTSLVSIIAVGDLLYSAQSIYARTFETMPLLLVVTFWYLAVVSVMSVAQYYLERYYSRDETRHQGGALALVWKNVFRFRKNEVVA
ncbi:amino acid ABC transporter permease [Mesorhizobium sp. B4-1-3]|uniref:amino acid ABC transporter permease n=1 Tax=Mesorhizobium sp. B4-1-3 TaxID=2589889 RepID=UPI00112A5977|nr:amino acid ABC transporter permease [Mesorhizobium sp. B4-1-3]TPI10500.1 amino acid ABC transporter permease [Mesorhizobium sp. B4-1-3]